MKVSRRKGFTLVEIMIVVAIIGIIIAIAVPAFLRARENSRGRACQENLLKIEAAADQWAMDNRRSNGATVPLTDLVGASLYIKRSPACPAGGTYNATITVGTDPTCTISSTNSPFVPHLLPDPMSGFSS